MSTLTLFLVFVLLPLLLAYLLHILNITITDTLSKPYKPYPDKIPTVNPTGSRVWSRPLNPPTSLEYYTLYTSTPSSSRPKSAILIFHPSYLTGMSPCRMGHESVVRSMESIPATDVVMVCVTKPGHSTSRMGEGGRYVEEVRDILVEGVGAESVVAVGWGDGIRDAVEFAGYVNVTRGGGGEGINLIGVGGMDVVERGDGGYVEFGGEMFKRFYRSMWVYRNLYMVQEGKSVPLEIGWNDDLKDLKYTHASSVPVLKSDNSRVLLHTLSSRLSLPHSRPLSSKDWSWKGKVTCWEFEGNEGGCEEGWEVRKYGGRSRLGVPLEDVVGYYYAGGSKGSH